MNTRTDLYRSVVRLMYKRDGDVRSLGSGVVFSPTGLVITNNHVIEDADFGTSFGEITVEFLQRLDCPPSESVPAELLIRNERFDLAVIQLKGNPPSNFIDIIGAPGSDASLMERQVRILGYPPLGGSTITITRGIVSGFDEFGNLKTDAEINPGNSGGAGVDDMDNFLGIPSFVVKDELGKLGFIICVNRIKEWFSSVMKMGLPETTHDLAPAFNTSNLTFSDENWDRSNGYPRILSKFAVVELLLANGEYRKVLPQIQFILEKRPRSALAYHYLGNAFLGLRNYLEAATQFRTALIYNPAYIPSLGNWGIVLLNLERHAEALQLFEQIIDDPSSNPCELQTAYHNIGQIYKERGKEELSRLYFQKAGDLDGSAREYWSQHTPKREPGDRLAILADAMMHAEIELDGKNSSEDKEESL